MNWAYIAGFLDCDGCILIRDRGTYKGTRISFYSTDKAVLEKIRDFIGCGKMREDERNWKGTKPLYYLESHANGDNLRILRKVLPHLEIKKNKAKRGIEILKKRPLPNYGNLRRKALINEVVRLYLSGKSQREIAEMFGVDHSAVSAYMRSHGYSALKLRRIRTENTRSVPT